MSSNLLTLDAVLQSTPRLFQERDVLGLLAHLGGLLDDLGP
ncbi:hypothetical protein ACWDYH_15335 [Nocardia goodfellowii]